MINQKNSSFRKWVSFLVIFISGILSFQSGYGQSVIRIEPDTLIYKVVDTTKLELYVYRPVDFSKKKTYPVVVFFHGGGWVQGKAKAFNRQCMYFASRGMIAITVEYRIKNIHGTSPFDAVEDAKSAIRYVREHAAELQIDPHHIAAGGGSAGGHIAAAAGIIEGMEGADEDLLISSVPDALLLFNPVIDNSQEGFGYKRIDGRYEEISPLHNITVGPPATIFFLGTEDKLIPVSTAEKYKKLIEDQGGRCDLFIYEGQGHSFFNKPPYFQKTIYEADVFLQSLGYLEGEPTILEQYPDPAQ